MFQSFLVDSDFPAESRQKQCSLFCGRLPIQIDFETPPSLYFVLELNCISPLRLLDLALGWHSRKKGNEAMVMSDLVLSSSLLFMHFWENDDPMKLANGLRAALDPTNSDPAK